MLIRITIHADCLVDNPSHIRLLRNLPTTHDGLVFHCTGEAPLGGRYAPIVSEAYEVGLDWVYVNTDRH
jgi:hypothetical protein